MEKAPPQLNLPSTKGKDIPMSTFNLGLPTDIPWERICFTTDMMHSPVCGGVRPSFGQSSIAVYSFTPDDEYQTLENYRISYVKVAVSLTPFDPNADANGGSPSTLITPYPCNGAVLQVSVGPSDPEGDARIMMDMLDGLFFHHLTTGDPDPELLRRGIRRALRSIGPQAT